MRISYQDFIRIITAKHPEYIRNGQSMMSELFHINPALYQHFCGEQTDPFIVIAGFLSS